MLLLRPRAKKDVWASKRVVRVVCVGVRLRCAGWCKLGSLEAWGVRQRKGGQLTEEKDLKPEEQIERYVLGLGLREEEEG